MHSTSLVFILSLAFAWLTAVECSPLRNIVSRGDCRVLTKVTYWGIACQGPAPPSCEAGQSYGGIVSYTEKTTFPPNSVSICEAKMEVRMISHLSRTQADIATSTSVALGRWAWQTPTTV